MKRRKITRTKQQTPPLAAQEQPLSTTPPLPPEFHALSSLSDPTLTGEQLQAIAAQFPSLWPQVLAHPNIYPGLAEWINANTEPTTPTTTNPAVPVTPVSSPGQKKPDVVLQGSGGKSNRWWIPVVVVIGVIAIAAGVWFGLKAFTGTPNSTNAGPRITSVVPVVDAAFAVSKGGSVYAWGDPYDGALGDGTTEQRLSPVEITGLPKIASVVSEGGAATFALGEDGSVYAWGDNWYGELGDGTTEWRSSPVQLIDLPKIASVTPGIGATFALGEDGSLYAWGDNQTGQLGDGTTKQRLSPVQVVGLPKVTSVASDGYSAFAVSEEGGVYSWGDIPGTKKQRSSPVQVVGLPKITSVAILSYVAYAVAEDGELYAWGSNGSGELGDGTMEGRSTPVQVLFLAE